ncbi:MAG: MarR family transcriptional regulator, partial [Chlamydiales bacterium]|nr:MarR family transcriptional regulator [Chlamydiales bacterium]
VLIEIRKIIRAVDLQSKQLVRKCGLTGPQMIILKEVQNSQNASVGVLAKNVSLSAATVTAIIDRLERRGLLVRQRRDDDKRKVMVMLTDEGEALLGSAPSLLQEEFIEGFESMETWEQHMTLAGLQRVSKLMNAGKLSVSPMLVSTEEIS